jgi:deoxycytidylate deaminase
MTRPDWYPYFLEIAHVVAKRGSCARRKVGCVLVSEDWKILSTGYNGPPSGLPNCIDQELSNPDLMVQGKIATPNVQKAVKEARKQCQEMFSKDSAPTLPSQLENVSKGLDSSPSVICSGASYESGEGLDSCIAVHAETNALIQCSDYRLIRYAFCTVSPCIHCIKALLNTPCEIIVFGEEYPHSRAKELWEASTWTGSITKKRLWIKLDLDQTKKN